MNLLTETIAFLADFGKSPEDVLWCGGNDCSFEWGHFVTLANVDYDDGYGAQEVAQDLVVVGDGWWLERMEYDGAEGWAFKAAPPIRPTRKVPDRIVGGMWKTIQELEESDEI